MDTSVLRRETTTPTGTPPLGEYVCHYWSHDLCMTVIWQNWHGWFVVFKHTDGSPHFPYLHAYLCIKLSPSLSLPPSPSLPFTPSQDIAVLTDNTSLCSLYETESFNVKPRGICRGQSFNGDNNGDRPYSPQNNEEDCIANGGRKCTCTLSLCLQPVFVLVWCRVFKLHNFHGVIVLQKYLYWSVVPLM